MSIHANLRIDEKRETEALCSVILSGPLEPSGFILAIFFADHRHVLLMELTFSVTSIIQWCRF